MIFKRRKQRLTPTRGSSSAFLSVAVLGMLFLFNQQSSGPLKPGTQPPQPGGTDAEINLKYMPSDAQAIAVVKMAEILASPAYKTIAQSNQQVAQNVQKIGKESGIPLSEMEVMIFGGQTKPQSPSVVVLHLKKPYTAQQILAQMNKQANPVQAGNLTIHQVDPNSAFCVVQNKLVVYGPTQALQQVVQQQAPPNFSPNLQNALKTVKLGSSVAFAIDTSNLPKNNQPQPGAPNFPPPQFAGVEVQVGVNIGIKATLGYNNFNIPAQLAQTAKFLVAASQNNPQLDPAIKNFLRTLQVAAQGNNLVVQASVPSDMIAKLGNAGGNLPGFPGGNNPPFPGNNPPQPPNPGVNPPLPPLPGGGKVVLNANGFLQRGGKNKHTVAMKAGKTYIIEMTSPQFDTFLYLYNANFQLVGSDDDGGAGLNSKLIYRPQQSGTYHIVAGAFANNGQGNYTITVRE